MGWAKGQVSAQLDHFCCLLEFEWRAGAPGGSAHEWEGTTQRQGGGGIEDGSLQILYLMSLAVVGSEGRRSGSGCRWSRPLPLPTLCLLQLEQQLLMSSMGTIGRLPGNGRASIFGFLTSVELEAKAPPGSLSGVCTALFNCVAFNKVPPLHIVHTKCDPGCLF